jgi:hypothetical protein
MLWTDPEVVMEMQAVEHQSLANGKPVILGKKI